MTKRRYGLYWNRRGELYNVSPVLPEDVRNYVEPICRIQNLTTGSASVQPCEQALDGHVTVGWFRPCTLNDLEAGFAAATTRGAFAEEGSTEQ